MVFWTALILCVAASNASPCTVDDHMVNDACSDVEHAAQFLQVATGAFRGSKESDAELNEMSPLPIVTKIKPLDCIRYAKPIQVLKEGNKGFAFKQLDVNSGKYKTIFDVPFKRVFPAYKDLNACGINPVDGIAYCSMWVGGSTNYLVRVDARHVEYVAKLPGTAQKFYNSGTFSPDGTFYIADAKANFLVLQSVNTKKGYPKAFSKGLPSLKDATLQKPKGFQSAADIVVVKKDLEGDGEKEYVIVLNKFSLMVAKCDDTKFTTTWVIPYTMAGKKGSAKDVWGAGWTFSGKVFFANNKGKGVYQIDLADLNLQKTVKQLSPFALKKIGKSVPSGFNDGANCMNSPDPWKTGVVPINCQKHGQPMQALRVPGRGYALHKVDLDSGAYEAVFDLKFTRTSPPFKYLNAIGINPIDSIAYGCLHFGDPHRTWYIVRFDGKNIEFVAKVLDKHDPVAGTFNAKGDFFFMHNTFGNYNPVLYSIPGLDNLKGFPSQNNKKLPIYKNLNGLTLWRYHHFADIVAVDYNLGGSGNQEYIVTINREKQAVFIEWDYKNASRSKVNGFTTNDPFAPKKQVHNYGAAWNYKGRVFFASNDGIGIVEMTKVNLAKATMTLKKVGDSRPVVNNDGFNCWVK